MYFSNCKLLPIRPVDHSVLSSLQFSMVTSNPRAAATFEIFLQAAVNQRSPFAHLRRSEQFEDLWLIHDLTDLPTD